MRIVAFITLELISNVEKNMGSTRQKNTSKKRLLNQLLQCSNNFVIHSNTQASIAENETVGTQKLVLLTIPELRHLVKIAQSKIMSSKEKGQKVIEKRLIVLLWPSKIQSIRCGFDGDGQCGYAESLTGPEIDHWVIRPKTIHCDPQS